MRVGAEEFERYVERAMGQLPEEFTELIDNVVVVVEDEADAETLEELELEHPDDLLGLYRGVPLGERETGYCALPDQVVLYRLPLLHVAADRRELIREIRDTLVHEIGHYFGLSDEEMPY